MSSTHPLVVVKPARMTRRAQNRRFWAYMCIPQIKSVVLNEVLISFELRIEPLRLPKRGRFRKR